MKRIQKIIFLYSLLFFLLVPPVFSFNVGSLFSPGELSNSHKKYEGVTNCVKCHLLGKGISEKKCLDCHKKIKKLIENKSGFHANKSTKCIRCHTEHKGLTFSILNLDKKSFLHDETGYKLTGSHKKADCDSCHKTKNTYLDAKRECLSCHKDEHKSQLKKECEICHETNNWKTGLTFKHNKDSGFILDGKHILVKCNKCHIDKRYKPINFKTCSNDTCHKINNHKGQFALTSCEKCHSTDGFKPSSFTHNDKKFSAFKLVGKHSKIKCGKCHIGGQYKNIPFKRCDEGKCHSHNSHKNQLVDDCSKCHNEDGFKSSFFSHANNNYTGFKLKGKHKNVKCNKCHLNGQYKNILSDKCSNGKCHDSNAHNGQFKDSDCLKCHNEDGFKSSFFSHSNDNYTGFKLKGKHKNIKCDKCHLNGEYRNIPADKCSSSKCHDSNAHNSQFKDSDCLKCHNEDSFKSSVFSHSSDDYNGFKLKGKHVDLSCDKCHKGGKYKPISYDKCDRGLCHNSNSHKKQFFGTDCSFCHNEAGFSPSIFTHEKSKSPKFKLGGKHKNTECIKCHADGRYKPIGGCIECHKSTYHKNIRRNCVKCHNEESWTVKGFQHNTSILFPFDSVHLNFPCDKCHVKDKVDNSYFSICGETCHKDKHDGQLGESCGDCHFFSDWENINFDHNRFNFILAGPHVRVACNDCHKRKTYKDVSGKCYSCHEKQFISNKHLKKKFSKECLNCHSIHNWNFKHKKSKDCLFCHEKDIPGRSHENTFKEFACANCHDHRVENWRFTHISVESLPACSLCHEKEMPKTHSNDAFGRYCEGCHSWEKGFKLNFFDTKKFPMLPKIHSPLSIKRCNFCHPKKFIDDIGICVTCHEDEKECMECHKKGKIKKAHTDKKDKPCLFCHLE